MVSKRRAVPSICGSADVFSGVISANLRVSFIKRSSRVPAADLAFKDGRWVHHYATTESRYPATLLQYNLAGFDHPLRG